MVADTCLKSNHARNERLPIQYTPTSTATTTSITTNTPAQVRFAAWEHDCEHCLLTRSLTRKHPSQTAQANSNSIASALHHLRNAITMRSADIPQQLVLQTFAPSHSASTTTTTTTTTTTPAAKQQATVQEPLSSHVNSNQVNSNQVQ